VRKHGESAHEVISTVASFRAGAVSNPGQMGPGVSDAHELHWERYARPWAESEFNTRLAERVMGRGAT
jgi:hypothetical protein